AILGRRCWILSNLCPSMVRGSKFLLTVARQGMHNSLLPGSGFHSWRRTQRKEALFPGSRVLLVQEPATLFPQTSPPLASQRLTGRGSNRATVARGVGRAWTESDRGLSRASGEQLLARGMALCGQG